ncbi:MAG: polyphosphate kinase 1 [Gemmatimonadales bacterium]|nr:MAG: polyphosphate kinase 1 [Gemmatimonadales bacterium]
MNDVRPQAPDEVGEIDLRDPTLFANRELSWLEFNRRVLHEAMDPRTPLLEQLKFIAIFSSNLDEFLQVRVAGLRQQVAAGYAERTADGLTPGEQLQAISRVVHDLQRQQLGHLRTHLLPALESHGIRLITDLSELSSRERAHVDQHFRRVVFPVLTPLAVDPAHPFPYISNLSLSIAVTLRGPTGEERFARVKVPKILPRWVPLTTPHHFVPLEYIIGENLPALFPGVEILTWHLFRITRNTDLQIDHDEAEDLLSLIQEEVRNQRFAEVVRIEVSPAMPQNLRTLLLREFSEEQDPGIPLPNTDDIYEVPGLLDAADLIELAGAIAIPELQDAPYFPTTQARLADPRSIFDIIRDGDLFLHHPYDSFTSSVERFIQQAADDPDVLAIKLTLYRTGNDSGIPRLLAHAAEQGKQVAVLIELQARFDEENNISWAQRLEDVGVHVSYGVAGLKTHTKILLVVRREGQTIQRYLHIGTGNYNARTARLYTDFGLLSDDPDLGADLTDLFNVLTGFGQPMSYRKLLVAPRAMRERFLSMIRREIHHAESGRKARIIAKMNALVDAELIVALYEASRAGVEIDLIIRGICCLRPGIPDVSDTIRVISILGRFLEHSRAFYFYNAGREEVYIGSADWMPRNLDRRIEAVVPLDTPQHRRAVRDLLELMLQDNRQAWDLRADGTYHQRRPPRPEEERATHRMLLERHRAAQAEDPFA